MRTNEELATAIQAGEREAIEQLWEQCYGFICQQSFKWAQAWKDRPAFDSDDFIQSGYIALCEAIKAYQADRGTFLHFLAYFLKTEFSKVAGCRTPAQMKEPLNNAISLDAPAYNDADSEATIGDTIPADDTAFEDVEEAIYKQTITEAVREAVASLPDRRRRAIEAYYLYGKTYSEIAVMMNVSTSWPAQLVKEGINDLRCGKHARTLAKLLWGEQNFYKRTGYTAWKDTGCSVQESYVLWKEREIKRYNLNGSRASKIRYCVRVLGMDRGQAERLFPV